jgi:hypothetical protein
MQTGHACSARLGTMHVAARRLHLRTRTVSGGRGSNCRHGRLVAGSARVGGRGQRAWEDQAGRGEREGVLGLSAAASHSAEAVGGCRWFALSEGDLTARDHLGVPIASLPLLGPPGHPAHAPRPCSHRVRAINTRIMKRKGISRHLLEDLASAPPS